MPGHVAPSLAAIDPNWLSAELRAGGHSEADVIEVRSEPLAFTGATTDMARLRVRYGDGRPGPNSMVAKIRGRDEFRVQMDQALGLFDREARFYKELRPDIPLRTPQVLAIGDGSDTPLVLEDLGDLRLGDQEAGIGADDAARCAEALAAMHAAYWQSDLLDAAWLNRPTSETFRPMMADLMLSGLGRLDDLTDQAPAGIVERFPHDAETLLDALAKLGEGPHTLAHADCRVDNCLFDTDGTPVFVDWQLPADARGTLDIANLLGSGVDPDELSASWEAILRRYHQRLLDGGVTNYSYDELIHHYRQHLIWPLGQAMSLMGALGSDDGRGVGETSALRALRHIAELDALSALDD